MGQDRSASRSRSRACSTSRSRTAYLCRRSSPCPRPWPRPGRRLAWCPPCHWRSRWRGPCRTCGFGHPSPATLPSVSASRHLPCTATEGGGCRGTRSRGRMRREWLPRDIGGGNAVDREVVDVCGDRVAGPVDPTRDRDPPARALVQAGKQQQVASGLGRDQRVVVGKAEEGGSSQSGAVEIDGDRRPEKLDLRPPRCPARSVAHSHRSVGGQGARGYHDCGPTAQRGRPAGCRVDLDHGGAPLPRRSPQSQRRWQLRWQWPGRRQRLSNAGGPFAPGAACRMRRRTVSRRQARCRTQSNGLRRRRVRTRRRRRCPVPSAPSTIGTSSPPFWTPRPVLGREPIYKGK